MQFNNSARASLNLALKDLFEINMLLNSIQDDPDPGALETGTPVIHTESDFADF
jgi:hypothetical protein